MLAISGKAVIFCFSESVDMRKGFEGLSALIQEAFSEPLTSGAYFIFVNRRGDRMKVLYWDVDGLVLWYKRLEKGAFIRAKEQRLTRREFFLLLEGVIPKKIQKRYRIE